METLQDRVDELSEVKAKKDELAVCPCPCTPHTLESAPRRTSLRESGVVHSQFNSRPPISSSPISNRGSSSRPVNCFLRMTHSPDNPQYPLMPLAQLCPDSAHPVTAGSTVHCKSVCATCVCTHSRCCLLGSSASVPVEACTTVLDCISDHCIRTLKLITLWLSTRGCGCGRVGEVCRCRHRRQRVTCTLARAGASRQP